MTLFRFLITAPFQGEARPGLFPNELERLGFTLSEESEPHLLLPAPEGPLPALFTMRAGARRLPPGGAL